MTVIDTLASRAGEVLGNGIPWSTFEMDPAADVYGRVDYYVSLAQEMRAVFAWSEEVAWTWDVVSDPKHPEALFAWGGMQAGILGKASVIDSALKVGKEKLGEGVAPEFNQEVLRAFFSQMFSLAMRGYQIHHNLILQHAGVDADRIVNNADMVFFTMRSLNRLHAIGAFEPFRKNRIGAISPAIAGVIAVGTIAALIVIAWFITKMTTILAQWEIANAACQAAIRNPENTELARACREAQESLHKSGQTKGPLDTLAVAGGVGLLILAVGYGILPNLKRKR